MGHADVLNYCISRCKQHFESVVRHCFSLVRAQAQAFAVALKRELNQKDEQMGALTLRASCGTRSHGSHQGNRGWAASHALTQSF